MPPLSTLKLPTQTWVEGNQYCFLAPSANIHSARQHPPVNTKESVTASGALDSSADGLRKGGLNRLSEGDRLPSTSPRTGRNIRLSEGDRLSSISPRTGRNISQRRHVSRNLDEAVILAKNIYAARKVASEDTMLPMTHGSRSLVGLSLIQVLRSIAWLHGNIPGYAVYGMHFLAAICDVASVTCTLLLFVLGVEGCCVKNGYLGPMMTLVFVMSLVDSGALAAFMTLATPRPVSSKSRSFLDIAEATVGVWEMLLIGSVAFQLALCISCWRIYRGLRKAGVYPPGNAALLDGEVREVSILEVMCEAEDAEMIANCECQPDDCRPTEGACRPFPGIDATEESTGGAVKMTSSTNARRKEFHEVVSTPDLLVDLSQRHSAKLPAGFQNVRSSAACDEMMLAAENKTSTMDRGKSDSPLEVESRREPNLFGTFQGRGAAGAGVEIAVQAGSVESSAEGAVAQGCCAKDPIEAYSKGIQPPLLEFVAVLPTIGDHTKAVAASSVASEEELSSQHWMDEISSCSSAATLNTARAAIETARAAAATAEARARAAAAVAAGVPTAAVAHSAVGVPSAAFPSGQGTRSGEEGHDGGRTPVIVDNDCPEMISNSSLAYSPSPSESDAQ